MKIHFDIDGTDEEVQAFLALIGFPVSTSLTEAEQAVIAKDENAIADRIHASDVQLSDLGKP